MQPATDSWLDRIEVWAWASGKRYTTADIARRQSEGLIAAIEDKEWENRFRPGRFGDGKFALFLTLPLDMPAVTLPEWLTGTCYAGMSYHMALGFGHNPAVHRVF